ncbi:Membrane-bound lytic murein transglycosylase B [Corynebacterium mycetoides]|uniref:Membrane-bound lytic murein transglycosylase B n=2 Tax=Corynebacterium mycetoides TaxID=38302 RepID=A0A1G9NHS0_9CORY|nr:Membrane-bound lytic murein transglycosylase B [Corynebacterium mycetoides]
MTYRPPRPVPDRNRPGRVNAGCGCAGIVMVVTAIVLIIALTGWMFSVFSDVATPATREPVPADVPPAAAQAPPLIDVHAPGRTSDTLAEWAAPIAEQTGIGPQAVRAYGNAALVAQEAWPQCNLAWNTLAGIGWVETRHGTYTGRTFDTGRLDEAGFAQPPIIGPALDGSGQFAEIRDTDGGALDGDATFDRAVGPMQFLPGSWRIYGRDANGDGVADPQQIDDAALASANLLCADNRDLSTPEGWRDAIFSYNNSNDYVVKVRDAAANYAMNQPAHR